MTTKPAQAAITLTNVRPLKPTTAPPNLVYIGPRRAGWPRSPLAMPHLHVGASRRLAPTALHRIAGLARRGDVLLGCWGPLAVCHGEVVKAAVEWILARLARPVQVGDRVCFIHVIGEERSATTARRFH
jgi:hypothetical protein